MSEEKKDNQGEVRNTYSSGEVNYYFIGWDKLLSHEGIFLIPFASTHAIILATVLPVTPGEKRTSN